MLMVDQPQGRSPGHRAQKTSPPALRTQQAGWIAELTSGHIRKPFFHIVNSEPERSCLLIINKIENNAGLRCRRLPELRLSGYPVTKLRPLPAFTALITT